jgi:hypothetical protein
VVGTTCNDCYVSLLLLRCCILYRSRNEIVEQNKRSRKNDRAGKQGIFIITPTFVTCFWSMVSKTTWYIEFKNSLSDYGIRYC